MADIIHVGLVQDGIFRPDYEDDHDAFLTTLEGEEVEAIYRKKRSKRTQRQNRWMHSFLRPLAQHLGYSLVQLKLMGLVAVFGTEKVGDYTVPIEPSTADLNTQKCSELCEWFVQMAAELDPPFLILYPEEFKREKKKQIRRGARASERDVIARPTSTAEGCRGPEGMEPLAAPR